MTKIITCSELRYRTLAELEALFRTLQIEFGRTAPGSPERTIVLASLDSVRRAMAAARLGSAAEATTEAVSTGASAWRLCCLPLTGREREFDALGLTSRLEPMIYSLC